MNKICRLVLLMLVVYVVSLLPVSAQLFQRNYVGVDGDIILDANNKTIKIAMMKERCINVTVLKRTTGDIHKLLDMGFDPFTYASTMSAITTSLTENEEVFMSLERVKGPFDSDHMAFLGVNGSSPFSTVCLYPGEYSIDAYLFRTNPDHFILEEDKREYCIGLGGSTAHLQKSERIKQMTEQGLGMMMSFMAVGGSFGAILGAAVFLYTNVLGQCLGKTEKIKINETDLGDTLIVGGVLLTNYTFSSAALDYGKMTFYVFSSPNPTIMEELGVMNDYPTLSEHYPFLVQPRMG
jgi:hypothetical protein